MLKRRPGRILCTLAAIGALTLAPAAGPIAAQPPGQVAQKALECNSRIIINLGSSTPVMSPAPGVEVPVTLKVANALSRDLFNADVAQTFSKVDFFGTCAMTGPCSPLPPPTPTVTYVPGSYTMGANPCVGTMNPPMVSPGNSNTSVSFDFGSPGINLAPAPSVAGPPASATCPAGTACECTIDFRVFVPSSAGSGPFLLEAMTMGICNIPPVGGFSSSATATVPLMVNPTMGEAALLALALILLAGAAAMLRRRGSAPALGA